MVSISSSWSAIRNAFLTLPYMRLLKALRTSGRFSRIQAVRSSTEYSMVSTEVASTLYPLLGPASLALAASRNARHSPFARLEHWGVAARTIWFHYRKLCTDGRSYPVNHFIDKKICQQ